MSAPFPMGRGRVGHRRAIAPDDGRIIPSVLHRDFPAADAVVVVNRDNGDVYVEVFTRDQLNDAARFGAASASFRRTRR